jgi:hypothetical protein
MKAHRIHRVPLSARCLAILAEARKLSDTGNVVFPEGTSDEPMSIWSFSARPIDDATHRHFRLQGRAYDGHRIPYRSLQRSAPQIATNLYKEVQIGAATFEKLEKIAFPRWLTRRIRFK